jgi:type I restriction enzyme M protein
VIRLCAMNLLLHNVGPTAAQLDDLLPVRTDDALRELGSSRYNIVATNPPFGRKSSIKVIGEEGEVSSDAITVERDDFWATTSNKQLNFLQHIKSLLKINGRAAVVLPDNVLFFERRAGSAQAATKRLWVYDLRTNQHFTLKTKPLQPADLDEFVSLYQPRGALARL